MPGKLLTDSSDLHDKVMPLFDAVLPEDPKIGGIQYWLFYTEKFLHILWIFLTILFIIDNEIIKVNFTLSYVNMKLFHSL